MATTPQEELLLKRLKRTKMLFAFLRLHRHELFDEAFQAELGSMYRDSEAGKVPVPPALLAMAILLQAYADASDAEAVELTVMDMRWQLVLNRLGEQTPAFSQGALQAFRQRMIAHDMDRRLLERTVELARQVGGFDPKKLGQLRIAVDSRPLEGAGRVEDSINLLGHVGRRLLEVAARLIQQDPSKLARDLHADDLLAKSIKGALDIDWSQPDAKHRALNEVLRQVEAAEHWVRVTFGAAANERPLVDYLDAIAAIREQNMDPDPSGKGQRLRRGVAKDRRVSVHDKDMRHGRKTKTRTFNGYKSHLAVDLDSTLILACDVSQANRPEAASLDVLVKELEGQKLAEAHIDRGYVASTAVAQLQRAGTKVVCKPWRQTREGKIAKTAFSFDFQRRLVRCPAGQAVTFQLGQTVSFDSQTCDFCEVRAWCTDAAPGRGRSLHVLHDEPFQNKMRRAARTSEGRALFRQRVPVEHRLAHHARKQGRKARYFELRPNLFDARRHAAVLNLEVGHRTELKAA